MSSTLVRLGLRVLVISMLKERLDGLSIARGVLPGLLGSCFPFDDPRLGAGGLTRISSCTSL